MRAALPSLILIISACATRAASPTDGGERVATATTETRRIVSPRNISLSDFIPAVAAVTEGGECDTVALGRDTYSVGLAFPSITQAQRRVALRIDGKGTILSYSDLRGDRRRPEARTGPLTVLTINFEQGVATAANEWPGRPAQLAFATVEAFLAADNLGRPGEMLHRVRTRCLAPPA